MSTTEQQATNSSTLVESLVTALESGKSETSEILAGGAPIEIQGVPVIVQPDDEGITLFCPDKKEACANLKRLSVHGEKNVKVKVCDLTDQRLSQVPPGTVIRIGGLEESTPKKNGHKNKHNGIANGANGANAADAQIGFEQVNAFLETSSDLDSLKQLKKTLLSRIKTVLEGEPEKSYKKKVKKGNEYWYEVYWDPVKKKKIDKYIGKKPPAIVK
jgi:hypothetical protein